MFIAFLYIVGLLYFGTIGFLIGRQTVAGSLTCWIGIGFVVIYVACIAVLRRLLKRRR